MNSSRTKSPRILVVSDDLTTLSFLRDFLATSSYELEIVTSIVSGLQRSPGEPDPDLILLELAKTGTAGLQMLKHLRTLCPGSAVVVLSSPGHTRQLEEAMRLGARDHLVKPLQEAELQLVLKRNLASCLTSVEAASAGEIKEPSAGQTFVAVSPAMRKVRLQAELLADINAPVLILGESGTGKEVIARLIHELSPRADRRFLKVNCAALPADLLESELFGYERGAFTGAVRTKPGKFELCNKGTILLDEIGEMPVALQAKMLHVLQDKQFFRLGGELTIDVDVRILAATNVDIDQALADRKLRGDLYYRLAAFMIHLPPLRERTEDIPILLQHFMNRLAEDYARPCLPIPTALLEACQHYSWPGNLRELENFVKRYLVMGDDAPEWSEPEPKLNSILTELPQRQTAEPQIHCGSATSGADDPNSLKTLMRSVKATTERNAIAVALAKTNWNRKQAARALGISYRGLLQKIQQYELSPLPMTELFEQLLQQVGPVGRC